MKTKKGIVAKVVARDGRLWPGSIPRSRWWYLIGRNGETLAHSECYTTRRKRDRTAKQVAAQLGVPYK